MDTYHAPYNEESIYWTGFILLGRCALFLTFAFSILGNVSHSWSNNSILTACKDLHNDYLEAAFVLNLCILAAGTYHVKEIGGNQAGLAYTSVGITLNFVAFCSIMCILA